MDVLASGLKDGGDWVLGKPVDLQVGLQLAQPVLVTELQFDSNVSAGAQPTPVIDRFYFKSVYFREPSVNLGVGVAADVRFLGPAKVSG